jgi:sulfatase maturation enzyme AslB (radical SAM superfamily)
MSGAAFTSCEFIEGAVSFMRNGVTFCCISHSGNKGWAKIMGQPSDSQLPSDFVDQMLAAREKLRAENIAGKDNACKGCAFLKEQAWAERPYLLDYVVFGHYNICNLRCNYCYLTEPGFNEPDYMYKVGTIVDELIDRKLLAPDSKIVWGGGEPTVSKEFRPLMSKLQAYGCRFWINTNAIVHAKEIVAGLASGRIEINVSIDAGTRETYHRVKAKDKFDIVWKNVARYAAVNPDKVIVKYIVNDKNDSLGEIEAFMEKAKEAGVRDVRVSSDSNQERLDTVREKTMLAAAYFIHLANSYGFRTTGTYSGNFHGKYGERIQALLSTLGNQAIVQPDVAHLEQQAAQAPELTARIAEITARLADIENSKVALHSNLVAAEHAIGAQRSQLEERDAAIAHLKNELEAANTRHESVIASTSWRVTEPLRKAKELIRPRAQ